MINFTLCTNFSTPMLYLRTSKSCLHVAYFRLTSDKNIVSRNLILFWFTEMQLGDKHNNFHAKYFLKMIRWKWVTIQSKRGVIELLNRVSFLFVYFDSLFSRYRTELYIQVTNVLLFDEIQRSRKHLLELS